VATVYSAFKHFQNYMHNRGHQDKNIGKTYKDEGNATLNIAGRRSSQVVSRHQQTLEPMRNLWQTASMRAQDAKLIHRLGCYIVVPMVALPVLDIVDPFDAIILLRVEADGKKFGALAVRVSGLRGSGISFGSVGHDPCTGPSM